ncbi:MAG: MATE family efflux transporter [Eubacteriales bacterium]|nr:MATE family efflux transporter [Eubacteriales bacterium]
MQLTHADGLWRRFRHTFLGNKAFYGAVLALILPIIVQNTVSNFVNLLDNVMVGAVGTLQMSGVAIANQLVFVFNLAIFGAVSGAGIYGAQFAGARDWEGLRQAFRFKLLMVAGITVVGVAILTVWGQPLLSLYLKGEGDAADAAAMLQYGKQYLGVMLWGLLPFALTQSYSGTLRENGETMLPMLSSLAAVLVNLVFNYLLIFGKFGFPRLGVQGAAIATVLSRFVELAVVAGGAHANRTKFFFLHGVYRSFRIGKRLAAEIAAKSAPLLLNELLWALGMTTLTQIFSTSGLMVVAGLNISSTVTNLFNVFMMSMGSAVAVMVGQALGSGDLHLARSQTWKLIFFSVCISVVLGAALALSAGAIPRIYNTEEPVRRLATIFMRTVALYMPFHSISHCSYFAMRSGGKTFITLLFDSAYTWLIVVPYTYLMVNFTGLDITVLYPLCFLPDAFKSVVGIVIVRTGYWACNVVGGVTSVQPAQAVEPAE